MSFWPVATAPVLMGHRFSRKVELVPVATAPGSDSFNRKVELVPVATAPGSDGNRISDHRTIFFTKPTKFAMSASVVSNEVISLISEISSFQT